MNEGILLRYKWREGERIVYRYSDGKAGRNRKIPSGWQADIALAAAPIADGGHVTLHCWEVAGGQWIDGHWLGWDVDARPKHAVCRVDARGRVLKVMESEGGYEGSEAVFGQGPAAELSQDVMGLPFQDLTETGLLHSCLLPRRHVRVGDTWTGRVRSPVAFWFTATDFEGRLVGLERDDGHVFAIIECKIRPSSVREPSVCEARFDVEQGRMVCVNWKTLAGAPPGWVRREKLIRAGSSMALDLISWWERYWGALAVLAVTLVLFFWVPLRIARRQWERKRHAGLSHPQRRPGESEGGSGA